ncbi:MAG: hypothetical protein U0271_43600 [Polyangiaceae bacterium]
MHAVACCRARQSSDVGTILRHGRATLRQGRGRVVVVGAAEADADAEADAELEALAAALALKGALEAGGVESETLAALALGGALTAALALEVAVLALGWAAFSSPQLACPTSVAIADATNIARRRRMAALSFASSLSATPSMGAQLGGRRQRERGAHCVTGPRARLC